MQEQMQKLQEKLKHTALAQSPGSVAPRKSPVNNIKSEKSLTNMYCRCGFLLVLVYHSLSTPTPGLVDISRSHRNLRTKRRRMHFKKVDTSLVQNPLQPSGQHAERSPSPKFPARTPSGASCGGLKDQFGSFDLKKKSGVSYSLKLQVAGTKLISLYIRSSPVVSLDKVLEPWVPYGCVSNGFYLLYSFSWCSSVFFMFWHVLRWEEKYGMSTIMFLEDLCCGHVSSSNSPSVRADYVRSGRVGMGCGWGLWNGSKISTKRRGDRGHPCLVPFDIVRFKIFVVFFASLPVRSASAAAPKKTVQTTLSNMVVKGAEAIALQARQKIASAKQAAVPCSDAFNDLMSAPTPGALNLKRHLSGTPSKGNTKQGSSFQSISASALLKQQKQQLLEARKKKAEEIQKRFLDSTSSSELSSTVASTGPNSFQSPKPAAEFPNTRKVATPRLGRGFSPGEDVLFFDTSPPSVPRLSAPAEAKKLAAIRKLQTKGQTLKKDDPNSLKRPRASSTDIGQVLHRVENNVVSPEAPDEQEPAMKRRREQLAYLQSEEFQKILKAKSKHTGVIKEAEAEIQEKYFEPLVKKEQLEEKMRSTREVKCRVVTCKTVSAATI
ncbi:MCM10 homolog [Pelobates cultripes]|nr:MCM10 homolog [Pelobates cultripes]